MTTYFNGKKVLIGITGGIAAYKIHFLIRSLIKKGAEVKVIMTSEAHAFITPLSISTLSKNPVITDFYTSDGSWNNHVELALWADVFIIAPCTANTLSKIAHGQADNFLLATYMSARCKVFIVPAMDADMYVHPATKANLEIIKSFGNYIIPSEEGELASGLFGKGRMAESEAIENFIEDHFSKIIPSKLKDKNILITAGPTYEAIDPVRFIGNHSSGKMGFTIANEAANRGANVILISGPSNQKVENPSIKYISVTSAKEMKDEVFKFYENVDIAIMSAAVSDYTPKNVSEQKIKKSDDTMVLELVKNPDILSEMGKTKTNQFLVGFALETNNETNFAKSKLQKKNLDMIVLNSLQDPGAGFKKDTNKITIFTKDNNSKSFELKNKNDVAIDILNEVETIFK